MMNNDLRPLRIERKTGSESFCLSGQPAGFNLLEFWRYLYAQSGDHRGQMFVIVVFVVAAAEAAVGLAMIISAYRRKNTIVANDINELKG